MSEADQGCGEKMAGIRIILILCTKPVLEGSKPNTEREIMHIKRVLLQIFVRLTS